MTNPCQSSLRTEGFIFASQFEEIQCILVGKTYQQGPGVVGYIESSIRKQRKNTSAQLTFFFLFSLGYQPMGQCCPCWWGVFSPCISISRNTLPDMPWGTSPWWPHVQSSPQHRVTTTGHSASAPFTVIQLAIVQLEKKNPKIELNLAPSRDCHFHFKCYFLKS